MTLAIVAVLWVPSSFGGPATTVVVTPTAVDAPGSVTLSFQGPNCFNISNISAEVQWQVIAPDSSTYASGADESGVSPMVTIDANALNGTYTVQAECIKTSAGVPMNFTYTPATFVVSGGSSNPDPDPDPDPDSDTGDPSTAPSTGGTSPADVVAGSPTFTG